MIADEHRPAEVLPAATRARLAVAAGGVVDPRGLDGRAGRAMALAARLGAPVAPALQAAQEAARQDRELARSVAVATAQSRLVGRGLVALPLLLVPTLDLLVGLPLVGFYGTPAGRAVGLVALALLVLGALTGAHLVRSVPRHRRRDPVVADDETTDLLGTALRAGLPASAAARAVAEHRPAVAGALRRGALALEHGHRVEHGTPVAEALAVLSAAAELGAPAAAELTSLASEQRAREQARVRERAERLPAQLTVPSVLFLLPATVLLVGAPVVAAGLTP